MTALDWCYLVLIASVLLADHFLSWPAFVHRSQHDAPTARRRLWVGWIVMLWALVAVGTALWIAHARAWSALGFSVPQGWRLWTSLVLVLGFAALQAATIAKVSRIKGPKPKLRAQFGDLAKILPHNSVELCWFIPAAVTAGVCEEWLFRGYLIWAFEPYLGWWAGALLSWAFFTAAHAYQGKSGTKQSGIVAAIMTLIVAVTGSLLPVIALHVAIDVTSGIMGWLVLRDEPSILHAEKPF
jgi:membrane protease YdiL (CAAX protease family)